MKKQRIRDYSITPGGMQPGPLNKITDVKGVLVGHSTISTPENKTGVTVILPGTENPFLSKPVAAGFVQNGFGKTCGLPQIEELGCLETPIALTNTLNVGLVSDALISHTIQSCEKEGLTVHSVNPVVGECNDSRINNICRRAVNECHVKEALEHACADFEEGSVGAGKGTVCYGFKGGIGSASRLIPLDGKIYTLGVLVQSNFGATPYFTIQGRKVGEELLNATDNFTKVIPTADDQGSIMMIIATDLPVSDRQLKRIIRRAANGLACTGSYTGHGSGEIMIGFTTANRIPAESEKSVLTQSILSEPALDHAFRAVGEATEEAVLNSMIMADTTQGADGRTYYSLREFASYLIPAAL